MLHAIDPAAKIAAMYTSLLPGGQGPSRDFLNKDGDNGAMKKVFSFLAG